MVRNLSHTGHYSYGMEIEQTEEIEEGIEMIADLDYERFQSATGKAVAEYLGSAMEEAPREDFKTTILERLRREDHVERYLGHSNITDENYISNQLFQ